MSLFGKLKGTPMNEAFEVDDRFCIDQCADAAGWKSTPKNLRTPTDYPSSLTTDSQKETWLKAQEEAGKLKCNRIFQDRCQKNRDGTYKCDNPGTNCVTEPNVIDLANAELERRQTGTSVPDEVPEEQLDKVSRLVELNNGITEKAGKVLDKALTLKEQNEQLRAKVAELEAELEAALTTAS